MSEPYTNNNETAGVLNGPPPKITITVAPVDPNGAAYAGPAPATGKIIPDYMITNRYEGDTHRYMAGLSSPGGFNGASVALFQLCAPTLLWICDWTAMQFQSEPDIPNPFAAGSEWEILDIHLEPAMLVVAGDGISPAYRISGTYFFACKNPGKFSSYGDSVFALAQHPRAPWVQDIFNRRIPADALKSDIMTYQGSSSSQRTNAAGFSSDGRVYPGWPG